MLLSICSFISVTILLFSCDSGQKQKCKFISIAEVEQLVQKLLVVHSNTGFLISENWLFTKVYSIVDAEKQANKLRSSHLHCAI